MNACQDVLKLKASLCTLTTLQLFQANENAIDRQLSHLTAQTPHFFQQLPVILDLQFLPKQSADALNLVTLTACVKQHGLVPVGVRALSESQETAALQMGLALFPNTASTKVPHQILASHSQLPQSSGGHSMHLPAAAQVITDPVRSGQQIYAQGDLIVLASVSPGAELLAEGHIHVYGRLEGRALAGVSDNATARIFCSHLAAELVSIAGHYWLNEDLHAYTSNKPVQIYLQDESLRIGILS